MTTGDVFSACKKRLIRHASTNLHSIDIQPEQKQHTCIGIAIDLEDATYMEQCITDAKLTVQEECSAAYVAGWLEMKCGDEVIFRVEDLLVANDVKEFIVTVSRGSLEIPHASTFELVRCGLHFMKEAHHCLCCQKRLVEILSNLATFSEIDSISLKNDTSPG